MASSAWLSHLAQKKRDDFASRFALQKGSRLNGDRLRHESLHHYETLHRHETPRHHSARHRRGLCPRAGRHLLHDRRRYVHSRQGHDRSRDRCEQSNDHGHLRPSDASRDRNDGGNGHSSQMEPHQRKRANRNPSRTGCRRFRLPECRCNSRNTDPNPNPQRTSRPSYKFEPDQRWLPRKPTLIGLKLIRWAAGTLRVGIGIRISAVTPTFRETESSTARSAGVSIRPISLVGLHLATMVISTIISIPTGIAGAEGTVIITLLTTITASIMALAAMDIAASIMEQMAARTGAQATAVASTMVAGG